MSQTRDTVYPNQLKIHRVTRRPHLVHARTLESQLASRQTNLELQRTREELRLLAASLMNAQDAERRRVSRELHDDLSQKFAKFQFDIERVEQQIPGDLSEVKRQLQTVAEQAATLSEDLRRLAHQLHPATLEILGLTTALRNCLHEFTRSSAILVRFSTRNVPKDLPIEVAGSIFRIAQEALRNVRKHSRAVSVEVALVGTPLGLEFSTRDNGIGFDLASVRGNGGLGLIGMRERVRLIDGEFSMETSPGRGVWIQIHVPLSNREGSGV